MAGMRSVPVWVLYVIFGVLYSLWALRLTQIFSADRRLGYLLALTDVAVLLPLAAWSSGVGIKVLVALVCGAGLVVTWAFDLRNYKAQEGGKVVAPVRTHRSTGGAVQKLNPENDLEAAVRARLRMFESTRARFGLVILRVLRFEELCAYYGENASGHIMTAIGRRGIRLLGQDAQRFPLPGGRMAFLFDTEVAARGVASRHDGLNWSDPYDVEGLAMSLGRKVCEHLIEGHRVECVVGWSSAPVDGLTYDDLLSAAEAGAHSTAAFRRVSGSRVSVRVVPTSGSARVADPLAERARTAVG
jgi:hypothetical protein